MAAALPTAGLAAVAGLSHKADLGLRATTHAGLAWSLGAQIRYQPRLPEDPAKPSWAMGLLLDESFYTVEQLAGIESLRSPFGNRLAATPQLLGSAPLSSGATLGLALGTEVGLVRLLRAPGSAPPSPAVRAWQPALDTAWMSVTGLFPRRRGALFVSVRAIVPVAADFHPLGYLPWLSVGRIWGIS